jgi:hypothetical protein
MRCTLNQFVSVIIVTLCVACSEKISVELNEISHYPEIEKFLIEKRDFEGTNDLDQSTLEFSVKLDNYNFVFNQLDSIALRNNWEIKSSKTLSRIYLKDIQSFPADSTVDTLKIEYNESSKRLSYKWS